MTPEMPGDGSLNKDVDDHSKYLMDRLRQLEEKNLKLREDSRRIETEKKFAESQKIKYEREVRRLRSEIERLKAPPLIVGTIVDVLGDDKVIIKSSTGPKFVVNVSQFVGEGDVCSGTQVALNQQSLSTSKVKKTPKSNLRPIFLG